jgi:hypothetical protein
MANGSSAPTRSIILAESRLLSEWLAARRGGLESRQHVYVGPVASVVAKFEYDPSTYRMLGVRRRWVDAIVLFSDRTELIEAKMVPDVPVIAQLQLYTKLFYKTEEFRSRWSLPLVGRVVSAVTDPVLSQMIQEAGFSEEVYHPPWVDDYLAGKEIRKTKVPTL